MSQRIRRSLAVAVLAVLAGPAAAQSGAAPPPAQPAPPPAPGSSSTAGSQGQSSTAQPSSPGASSQQVVVNPPQPVQPSAPPSSTTVVNPPPPSGGATVVTPPFPQTYGEVAVVERRREKPNPLATVAMDAAYGGVAGLLVGGGVALVQQGDNWGRDIMVGAGVGLIVGAAVGVVHALYDQQQYDRAERRAAQAQRTRSILVAGDGLNRTDRDPVISGRNVAFAFQF